MSDANANLIEGPFQYNSFGSMAPCLSGCSGGEPYKFTGQRLDPETGLYYYRARYYSPVLGRFLQVDPVGYTADMDLYTYVGNDPTNMTDPLGLATTCSGSGDNQVCTTTADTFKAGSSNSKTVQASSTTDKAAISGKGLVAVPSGNQEKLGFIQSDSKGNQSVVPAGDTKTSSTATTDTASATVPGNAIAAIHGHIDSKSQGMVDAKKGPGDAQSLTLKHAMPNYTVSKDRVGVHELVSGRLQFRMVQGQMSSEETQAIQGNLDREQQLFQGGP
ncbi:MAG: RHS repeat-associated core domain-containing protein [Rhizomicrobium sp.]